MRLGLVIYGDLETVSGGYFYDRQLVDYLTRQGDRVATISIPRERYARCLRHGFSADLQRTLRSLDVDILLEDELCHPSLFHVNHRLKGHVPFPIISVVHHLRSSEPDLFPRQSFFRTVEKAYLKSVQGFIFVSRFTAMSVENLLGHKADGVIASPGRDHLGFVMDEAQVVSRAREVGPLRIIFVGNLIPRKGLHFLLGALSSVRGQNWRLTIIGNGDSDPGYARNLDEIVEGSGLKDRIERPVDLSKQALHEKLKESHILAVPSTFEGYGIAYLEALGFGLPVIAAAIGGACEIITHGREGYLVEPGDIVKVADHISGLARDREMLVRMSLAALKRYREHPTWDETLGTAREYLAQKAAVASRYS